MSELQWSKDEVAAFEAVLQSMDEQKHAPITWRVGPYIAGVNREARTSDEAHA